MAAVPIVHASAGSHTGLRAANPPRHETETGSAAWEVHDGSGRRGCRADLATRDSTQDGHGSAWTVHDQLRPGQRTRAYGSSGPTPPSHAAIWAVLRGTYRPGPACATAVAATPSVPAVGRRPSRAYHGTTTGSGRANHTGLRAGRWAFSRNTAPDGAAFVAGQVPGHTNGAARACDVDGVSPGTSGCAAPWPVPDTARQQPGCCPEHGAAAPTANSPAGYLPPTWRFPGSPGHHQPGTITTTAPRHRVSDPR